MIETVGRLLVKIGHGRACIRMREHRKPSYISGEMMGIDAGLGILSPSLSRLLPPPFPSSLTASHLRPQA
jgi:hypothetical protein